VGEDFVDVHFIPPTNSGSSAISYVCSLDSSANLRTDTYTLLHLAACTVHRAQPPWMDSCNWQQQPHSCARPDHWPGVPFRRCRIEPSGYVAKQQLPFGCFGLP
jgi:hypothetical protein